TVPASDTPTFLVFVRSVASTTASVVPLAASRNRSWLPVGDQLSGSQPSSVERCPVVGLRNNVAVGGWPCVVKTAMAIHPLLPHGVFPTSRTPGSISRLLPPGPMTSSLGPFGSRRSTKTCPLGPQAAPT